MKISIVVPMYNLENCILRTLSSIAAQSDTNFELVLVDDGSTDATIALVKDFFEKEVLVTNKIISQKNQGVSAARNRGIEEASGEYIIFLDGDDYVSSNLVEKLNEHIEKERLDVIHWGFNRVREDGSILNNYIDNYSNYSCVMNGINVLKKILIERSTWICTGSAAYRKDLLLKHRLSYTIGCVNGEDQEFTYKVLLNSQKVLFTDEVHFYYVQRINSFSNSFSIKLFDSIFAFNRTIEYVNNHGTKQTSTILKGLEKLLIESYLYYVELSFFSNAYYQNINLVIKEIEFVYPGLNKLIISFMRRMRFKNKKLSLKIIFFLISPQIYISFIRLKRGFCNDIFMSC